MTEASGLIAIDPVAGDRRHRIGGLGLALHTGRGAAGWGRGRPEPCARVNGCHHRARPAVSPGYRDPAHDAGVIEGGVLDTGDLGYTDAAGRIHIAGRSKDLIIRSGHNIDPVMIENAMTAHPAVPLAAAVGMPDAYAGELPVCFVVLRAGASVSEAELHAHARQAIAERPAWPKQFHIVDAIPVTSVGKIFKPELRCDAAARLVRGVLREQHQLPDAHVQVSAGGPRGLVVHVILPATAAAALPAVTQALASYLFEARVEIA